MTDDTNRRDRTRHTPGAPMPACIGGAAWVEVRMDDGSELVCPAGSLVGWGRVLNWRLTDERVSRGYTPPPGADIWYTHAIPADFTGLVDVEYLGSSGTRWGVDVLDAQCGGLIGRWRPSALGVNHRSERRDTEDLANAARYDRAFGTPERLDIAIGHELDAIAEQIDGASIRHPGEDDAAFRKRLQSVLDAPVTAGTASNDFYTAAQFVLRAHDLHKPLADWILDQMKAGVSVHELRRTFERMAEGTK